MSTFNKASWQSVFGLFTPLWINLLLPLGASAQSGVAAWGFNMYGQVGDGTTTNRPAAVPVIGLPNVVAVAGGYRYSLALDADGAVWAWGSNWYGELGDDTAGGNRPTPARVSGITDVVAIVGANNHTLELNTPTAWRAPRETTSPDT